MAITREDYLNHFRQNNPTLTSWSDDDILASFHERYGAELDQHPALAEFERQRRIAATSPLEEIKGAVGSGVDSFQGKLYDTAALAGRVTGMESLEEWGRQGADRNEAQAAEFAPAVGDFRDIRTPQEFGYWLANIAGTNAPQLAGTATAALAGVALAPKAAVGAGAVGLGGLAVRVGSALGLGAGKTAVAGLSAKALAALGGSTAVGFTQMQNFGELEKLGGEDTVPLAVANGLLGSVLEAAGPAALVSKLVGQGVAKEAAVAAVKDVLFKVTPGPVLNVALAAARHGSTEMLTELAQESLTIVTETVSNRNNPDFSLDDDQIRGRLINSGVAGFVLGGVLGGATGRGQTANVPEATGLSTTATGVEAPPAKASLDPQIAPLTAAEMSRASALQSLVQPPAPAAPVTPAPATIGAPVGPVVASPATQQQLVSLGVDPVEAAQFSEEDAQSFIARVRAESEAAQQRAAAEAASAQRAQTESAIAAQVRQQQLDAAQAELEAEARGQLSAAQPEFAVPVSADARVAQIKAARPPQVKTAGIVGALQGNNPSDAMTPASQPGVQMSDILQQGKEPSAAPAVMSAPPVVSLPAAQSAEAAPAAPAPTPTPTPAPARTPVAPTHGLRKISDAPLEKFISATEVPSPAAAGGDPRRPSTRFALFLMPDGTGELRRVDRAGVEVRANTKANPRSIAEAVTASLKDGDSISKTLVIQVLKDGAKSRYRDLILDEADRQGYDFPGSRVPLRDHEAASKGKWVGVFVAPANTPTIGVQKLSVAETDAVMAKVGAAPASPAVAAPAPAVKAPTPTPTPTPTLAAVETTVPSHVTLRPEPERLRELIEQFSADAIEQSLLETTGPRFTKAADAMLELIHSDSPAALDALRRLSPADRVNLRAVLRGDIKNEIARVVQAPAQVEKVDRVDSPYIRREASPDDYLAGDETTEKRFFAGVREAAARGAVVKFGEAEKALSAGGYSPTKGEIHLALANVAKPTRQDLLALVHETLHHLTENAAPWMRRALHDTFERMAVGEKAFYQNPAADPRVRSGKNTARLGRVEYLMEQAVEHATIQGIGQDYAQGIIPAVWRAVKELLLRAAVYVQGKLKGEENVGGTLAKQWVETLATQVYAADRTTIGEFLAQFGRPPTFAQILRHTAVGDHIYVNEIDPRTGVARVRDTYDLSPAGAEYRAGAHIAAAKAELAHNGELAADEAERELRELFGAESDTVFRVPGTVTAETLNASMGRTIEAKRVATAVANQMDRLHRQLYDVSRKANPELDRKEILAARREGEAVPDDLTFEVWRKRHGFSDMGRMREIEVDTLRAQIKAETGKDFDVEGLINPAALIDDLPAHQQAVADEAFLAEASKALAKSNRILDHAVRVSGALSEDSQKKRAVVQEMNRRLADWKSSERGAVQGILANLRQMQSDRKAGERVSEAAGTARATIEALEGDRIDRFDTEFTEKVLGSINFDELPLASIFKQLFAAESARGLDLADMSPAQMRDLIDEEVALRPDSSLSALHGREDVRPTALLAAIHAFIKQEGRRAAIIRLQLDESVQRNAQINEVRAALEESNEATLADIRERVSKDLKRPGNRVIFETLKERDAALRDQRRLAEADRTILMLRRTRNALNQSVSAAQQRLGVSANWQMTEGAMVFNPASPEMTSEELNSPQNQHRLSFLKNESSTEELIHIRRAMGEWIDARRDSPEKQDATYRTMIMQRDRLTVALSGENHQMLAGLKNGFWQNFATQMDRTGTRGGRLLARMFRGLESAKRAEERRDEEFGRMAEKSREAFYKAAGVKPEWEKANMYDDAFYIMIRASGATADEGIARVRESWRTHEDPTIRHVALNEDLWTLYAARLRDAQKNNRRVREMSTFYGNRVRDEKITVSGAAALRMPIERGAEDSTLPTRLNRDVPAALHHWKGLSAFLDRGAPASPITDMALKLRNNPEELRTALRDFFADESFRETILDPMVADEVDPNMPAPARADGLSLVVPGPLAVEEWGKADGDLIKWAESVYLVMGESGDTAALEAYQLRVLNHVQNTIHRLAKRANVEAPAKKVSILGLPHLAMDSVMEDDFKRQWVSFPDFSVEENRSNSHVILANAFLGRNMDEAREAANVTEATLQKLAGEMPPDEAGRKALKAADPEKFKKVEEAVSVYNTWRDGNILAQIDREFNPEADPLTNGIGLGMEIFSLVTQGMLMGPRTALKDLSSFAHPLQMERSISLTTGGRVVKMAGKLAKHSLASGMNALFGTDVLRNDWKTRAIEDATGRDPAAVNSLKNLVSGTRGKGNHFEASPYGKIQRALRITRNVMGGARLGFGGGARGAALRWNFHGASTQYQRFAATEVYMDTVVDLARRTAEFYARNPGLAGQPVTAQQIRYSDTRGFASLKEQLDDYGVRIEEIAERVARKPDLPTQDILSKKDIIGIHSMANGRILGEGGTDTRMSLGRGSRAGRVSQTFIGWSFWKGGEAWNMLRDAKGRRDIWSITNGAAAAVLGLMPIGIAMSLALDYYDEELIKKRANQLAYSRDMTPEMAFNATLQRAATMGTFGLPGELASKFVLPQDGAGQKTLSVDERIVWLNTLQQFGQALQTLHAVGFDNANYANVGRQFLSSLGGGGLLQNVQLVNGLFGPVDLPLFRGEASVTARINVNNFLRAAGTDLRMDVRVSGGKSLPNATTPWVSDMVLAAITNDPDEFQKAFIGAVKAAESVPTVTDPRKYVIERFAARHPLKTAFATNPSTQEVHLLMSRMPDAGRDAVSQAIGLFNNYGARLGIPAYAGAQGARTGDLIKRQARSLGLPARSASLAAIRDEIAARRNDGDDY